MNLRREEIEYKGQVIRAGEVSLPAFEQ